MLFDDTRKSIRGTKPEWDCASFIVDETANLFPETLVCIQMPLESPPDLAGAHNEHMLHSNPALDSLCVLPLHKQTHGDDGHKTENSGDGKHQAGNRLFPGYKYDHGNNKKREAKRSHDSSFGSLCRVDDCIGTGNQTKNRASVLL